MTEPQPNQTTDYTTIEPPAKETVNQTVKPSTGAPPTTKKVTRPLVPSTDSSKEASELSKLGEMKNLIEELNFQNQQIQTQLQNYKENNENWDSTKENFQMGVFMSVMIIFLCFLLSKVCKLPFLARVKYGAL